MALYVKYNPFIEGLTNKLFDIFGDGTTGPTADLIKVAIGASADPPVAATDDELADQTQVTGTGYTAGGMTTLNISTRTTTTVTETATDAVFTATSTDWTAGQTAVRFDDISTTDRLMNYWDYASAFTLGNGETFTVDFQSSVATYA